MTAGTYLLTRYPIATDPPGWALPALVVLLVVLAATLIGWYRS